MEVEMLVHYSTGATFDRYSPCIRTEPEWGFDAAVSEVTVDEEVGLQSYTVDDVAVHNNLLGRRDWFKYGRKVYSVDKIKIAIQTSPLLKEDEDSSDDEDEDKDISDDEDDEDEDEDDDYKLEREEFRIRNVLDALGAGYPIYSLRKAGVSRSALRKLLSDAVVGDITDIETYTQLVRFKEWIEGTLQELGHSRETTGESETLTDFREQLSRWLKDYPCVEKARYSPPVNCIDHNDNFFPLPTQIMCNPLVLRHWTEEWKVFDTKVPDEGAWHVKELLNEDIDDTHGMFVDLLRARVDDNIEEFDMEIDGEAAWTVIEDDVVKNDKATAEQDRIWETRCQREHIDDPEWMRNRRKQIANKLMKRHKMAQEKLDPYLSMYDRLEKDWNKFQELCRHT